MEGDTVLFMLQIINSIVQTLSLIFLIIYVVKTWQMASSTRKAAEATESSVLEMRESRYQETAPYVIVYFDASPQGNHLLYLVVKNVGKSIAKNVKIQFNPPLQNSGTVPLKNLIILNEGIASIPPGYEIRTIVDTTVAYFGNEGLPLKYNVKVSYSGGLQAEDQFIEQILDLSALKGLMETRRYDIHDIADTLMKLADEYRELRKWVRDISYTLKEGIFINNPDIVVSSFDQDISQWKEKLLVKLQEFVLIWSSLSKDERNQGINLKRLQSFCLLISSQILVIISHKSSKTDDPFVELATDIARRLHDIGKMQFYMDGGLSVETFNKKGDGIAEDIKKLTALHESSVSLTFENREQRSHQTSV